MGGGKGGNERLRHQRASELSRRAPACQQRARAPTGRLPAPGLPRGCGDRGMPEDRLIHWIVSSFFFFFGLLVL